jgi:hypothetical protein
MKKAYICGKVTGEPLKECKAKFQHAKQLVEPLGYEVVNPMEIVPNGTNWAEAMRICVKALMDCDVLFAMPDANSRGAIIEQKLANTVGIQIIDL